MHISEHLPMRNCNYKMIIFFLLCALWQNVYAQDVLTNAEKSSRAAYFNALLRVQGSVLDANGQAVAGARIQLGTLLAITGVSGQFRFENVKRDNYLMQVRQAEFKDELLMVSLHRKTSTEKHVVLEPVILGTLGKKGVRMIFGGDVAFGRRFLDPDELTPRNKMPKNHPDALIQASNPDPGSKNILRYIRPFYQEADWGSINFETPVTDNPSTPHPTKDYAFFTLPGSLPSLKWLGLDYVGLGNNHVFDYLGPGLSDTMHHLQKTGLPFSGAGINSEAAFKPYRTQINGQDYSFLAASSITGTQHPISFVADDLKGGAADLTDMQAVKKAILDELKAGFVPIFQVHGGIEYTFEPTPVSLDRLVQVADAGAALVIAHHPHVAQGVGYQDGVYMVHSLGNLAFDQARIETMLGLMARVDMQGSDIQSLRLVPVYLEDFRPRPIAGDLASRFLRRIGEFSTSYNTLVYPYHGQGWVTADKSRAVATDRKNEIEVHVPENGVAIVDLRSISTAEESLLAMQLDTGNASLQMGRDILQFGDMEDWDADEQIFELSRWDDSSPSIFACTTNTYRGSASLCSTRAANNKAESVIALRNRVRVMGDALNTPNKDLSFFGYASGQNAGAIQIVARYFSSEEKELGSKNYGDEVLLQHAGGSFSWQAIRSDMHMPADDPYNSADPSTNARSLRIFLRHASPITGEGTAAFDDIAIINWEDSFSSGVPVNLPTPHARDFIRVKATPGVYKLALTFRTYRPKVADTGLVTH